MLGIILVVIAVAIGLIATVKEDEDGMVLALVILFLGILCVIGGV